VSKNQNLQSVCSELDAAGIPYRVQHGGKHIRVCFGSNYERTQIVPGSPSDKRGWLNSRAQVRRTIRAMEVQG
jgi:hypothetical protein